MAKTSASIDQIRALYFEKKLPVAEIAKHLGVTRQAVHERMRREGIGYRSRKGLGATEISKSELERLHVQERLTIAEIARRMGYSWRTVAGALDRCGIERLNNRELKELTPGLVSMKIGDRLELETDGRFPFWIYHEAKRLNFRLVIRTRTPTSFSIIRTPLLNAVNVRTLIKDGMNLKEIARIFFADPKTIKRLVPLAHDD